jgi:hypothetical protein
MDGLVYIKNLIESENNVHISDKSRGDLNSVLHRWIYFKLARVNFPEISLNKIGSIVNRHHATVIYGLQQIENEFFMNKSFRDKYEKLADTCAKKLFENNLPLIEKRIQFLESELNSLNSIKNKFIIAD